jgi:hypothetical protein
MKSTRRVCSRPGAPGQLNRQFRADITQRAFNGDGIHKIQFHPVYFPVRPLLPLDFPAIA